MKNPLLFIVFFVVCRSVMAQQPCTCFIQGKVTEQKTRQPIVGVAIYIKELKKGVFSDASGNYRLLGLCPDTYTLVCNMAGYETQILSISLKHGVHEQGFELSEAEHHLQEVNIKTKKITDGFHAKNSISNRELDQTRGQVLGEALQQLSGVTMLQTGSSVAKPVIHGLHSNRVLVLNNGVRQEGQQWGSEHAPEIDPFVAKKLSVIKGAAGIRYGSDALGGVVLVEPEKLSDSAKVKTAWHNTYFSNGRQATSSFITEGGLTHLKGFAWRLQGTVKRGGDMNTPTYRLANTGVSEVDFSVSAGFNKNNWRNEVFFSQFNTQIGLFAGSHIGNLTDLLLAIQRGTPASVYTPQAFSYTIERPYQDIQHNLLKLFSVKHWNSGNRLSWSGSRQYNFRQEVDILRGDRNLIQQFLLTTYASEWFLEHRPIFKSITGSAGLTASFQENISSGGVTIPVSATVLIPNYRQLNTGIFWIEQLSKAPFEIEMGIRFDRRNLDVYRIPVGERGIAQQTIYQQKFTATFGINYELSTYWKIQVSAASAWRPPSVNELFSEGVHHGTATFEQGDSKLIPEKALNTAITLLFQQKNIQAEIHTYSNNINDFIFLAPTGRTVLSIRGAFPEYRYTQTNAQLWGIDVAGKWQFLPKISFATKGSFLKAIDQIHEQPLIFMPANRIENTLEFKHRKMVISFSNKYVAKQNNIPTKFVFNDILPAEIVFKDYAGDFAPPPPAYSLWSMSVGNTSRLFKKITFDYSLTVSNLLDTSFRDYLNRFRYFSDDIGRNISFRTTFSF